MAQPPQAATEATLLLILDQLRQLHAHLEEVKADLDMFNALGTRAK